MDTGVGLELRIVRLMATLLFFWTVVMTVVTLQDDRQAWGYGTGAVMVGIMLAFLWKDDLVATGNNREQQKGADIRQQQGFPVFPAQVQAQQVQPTNPALPSSGPSGPIQHSG